MATSISATQDWVEGICIRNLGTVAQSGKALYYVGGFTVLRDGSDPNTKGLSIANSYLYKLDFSGNGTKTSGTIDLETDFPGIVTADRVPDAVPRTMWGNFFSYNSELHMFGGLQITQPIYLANGSASLAPRVTIEDKVWSYDLGIGTWYNTWSGSTDRTNITSGLGTDVLGQAAKAQDMGSGKAWMYGGATWSEPYTIGDKQIGNNTDFKEMRDLLQSNATLIPQAPDQYFMEKVTTETASSAQARPGVQAVMVFIPGVGSEGVLVLFSGSLLGQEASLQTVHIYDIHNQKWYSQPTSAVNGEFPHDRTEACAVAASAPDGSSHNIYLYGGKYKVSDTSYPPLPDVWVLSLPSFQWVQISNSTENSRVGHTCRNVNEHYMVTYGGFGQAPCDRYGGIQFLDLNTAQFTTKMEVDGTYSVPEKVYQVIGGSGNGGATTVIPSGNGFSDDALRTLFKTNVTTNTTIHTPSLAPSASDTSGTNHTVLLATLIPILLILFAAIGFFFWRRRNRGIDRAELPPAGAVVTADRKYYGELSTPDAGAYGDKSDVPRSELEANFPSAAELPTTKVDDTIPAVESAPETQREIRS